MTFYRFPKIRQAKDVLKSIDKGFRDQESVELEATVKLHGCCVAIVKHGPDEEITYQSRNQTLTLESDHINFAKSMTNNALAVRHVLGHIEQIAGDQLVYPITVFGEWCGRGVQHNVALSRIDLTLVILKIAFGEDMKWQNMHLYSTVAAPPLIRNIHEIPCLRFTWKRGQHATLQQEIKTVVDEIDRECPFTRELFGILGAGEGLVIQPKDTQDARYWFKCKGDAHKVRPPPVDDADLPLLEHVTYERIQGALEALGITDVYQKFRGVVNWVIEDIADEEGVDKDALQDARTNIIRRVKAITAES